MLHKHRSNCRQPDGGCKDNFPRPCVEHTHLDDRGFVQHRRRGAENANVVPYNAECLQFMETHLNVEVAATVNIIAYLFKYFFKGRDRTKFRVDEPTKGSTSGKNGTPSSGATTEPSAKRHRPGGASAPGDKPTEATIDEIHAYLSARYVSATEAVWRIFGFNTHSRSPPVVALPVHLEGEDSVVFQDGEEIDALDTVPLLERYFNRPRLPEFDVLRYDEYFTRTRQSKTKPRSTYAIDEHPTQPRFVLLRV